MTNVDRPQILKVLREAYPGERGLRWVITRLRARICPFEEILRRIPRDDSVLDVGCGIGLLSVLATELAGAATCVGVDVSAEAISAARSVNASRGKLRFEVAADNQWGDDLYGTALCVDVLHHVPRPSRAEFVAKLCAAVRPGGIVLLKEISPRPRWKCFCNFLHDLIMARQCVSCTPAETVGGWLEEAGMTIRETQRIDRLWYSHYLLVAEKKRGCRRAA